MGTMDEIRQILKGSPLAKLSARAATDSECNVPAIAIPAVLGKVPAYWPRRLHGVQFEHEVLKRRQNQSSFFSTGEECPYKPPFDTTITITMVIDQIAFACWKLATAGIKHADGEVQGILSMAECSCADDQDLKV